MQADATNQETALCWGNEPVKRAAEIGATFYLAVPHIVCLAGCGAREWEQVWD